MGREIGRMRRMGYVPMPLMRLPPVKFQEWMVPWRSPIGRMRDKEFLAFGRLKPNIQSAQWDEYKHLYDLEFARRFYLRPIEAKPNTQDGSILVRAVTETR